MSEMFAKYTGGIAPVSGLAEAGINIAAQNESRRARGEKSIMAGLEQFAKDAAVQEEATQDIKFLVNDLNRLGELVPDFKERIQPSLDDAYKAMKKGGSGVLAGTAAGLRRTRESLFAEMGIDARKKETDALRATRERESEDAIYSAEEGLLSTLRTLSESLKTSQPVGYADSAAKFDAAINVIMSARTKGDLRARKGAVEAGSAVAKMSDVVMTSSATGVMNRAREALSGGRQPYETETTDVTSADILGDVLYGSAEGILSQAEGAWNVAERALPEQQGVMPDRDRFIRGYLDRAQKAIDLSPDSLWTGKEGIADRRAAFEKVNDARFALDMSEIARDPFLEPDPELEGYADVFEAIANEPVTKNQPKPPTVENEAEFRASQPKGYTPEQVNELVAQNKANWEKYREQEAANKPALITLSNDIPVARVTALREIERSAARSTDTEVLRGMGIPEHQIPGMLEAFKQPEPIRYVDGLPGHAIVLVNGKEELVKLAEKPEADPSQVFGLPGTVTAPDGTIATGYQTESFGSVRIPVMDPESPNKALVKEYKTPTWVASDGTVHAGAISIGGGQRFNGTVQSAKEFRQIATDSGELLNAIQEFRYIYSVKGQGGQIVGEDAKRMRELINTIVSKKRVSIGGSQTSDKDMAIIREPLPAPGISWEEPIEIGRLKNVADALARMETTVQSGVVDRSRGLKVYFRPNWPEANEMNPDAKKGQAKVNQQNKQGAFNLSTNR